MWVFLIRIFFLNSAWFTFDLINFQLIFLLAVGAFGAPNEPVDGGPSPEAEADPDADAAYYYASYYGYPYTYGYGYGLGYGGYYAGYYGYPYAYAGSYYAAPYYYANSGGAVHIVGKREAGAEPDAEAQPDAEADPHYYGWYGRRYGWGRYG